MKKSKLFNIISSFTADDWNKCFRHLEARKSESKELRLFKFLKNNQKKLDSDKLSIDNLKNSTILGYNTKKNVQNIMSRLTLMIEDYMILDSFNEDQIEREFRLFKCYNDRGLFKLANNKADALIQHWVKNSPIDRIYFEYILKILHHQYFSYNPINRYGPFFVRLNQALLTLSAANTELYKYATEAAVSSKTIDEKDLVDIGLSSNRLTDSYFGILTHLNDKEQFGSNAFNYLYNELIENKEINTELRAIMFTDCENYLRRNVILAKNSQDSVKLLDLYEYGVKNKLLTYNEKIGTLKFQNIIQLACFLKQFDWAESFQLNYGQLLAKEHLEESKFMTAIQLSFGRLKYVELIDIILFNEFKFFPFRVQSRWFLISTYLITFDNLDFFESQLSNFTQFIYYNQSKLSKMNFEGSLNLAKIFRSYVTKPDFSLDEEISKYENIVFKNRLPEFFSERKRYVEENNILI